ncbi:MAG: glycosyltransferase family 2 protein [Pseudomonadales bacterium]
MNERQYASVGSRRNQRSSIPERYLSLDQVPALVVPADEPRYPLGTLAHHLGTDLQRIRRKIVASPQVRIHVGATFSAEAPANRIIEPVVGLGNGSDTQTRQFGQINARIRQRRLELNHVADAMVSTGKYRLAPDGIDRSLQCGPRVEAGCDDVKVQNHSVQVRMSIFVSVVIPVKNDADGLRKTLGSLPVRDALEVIIIDGGSSDGTLDVISAQADRIRYWESGLDTGIADAMNRGVARAEGDYVAILNAGDVWLDRTLDLVMREAAENPTADVLHGTIEYAASDGRRHLVAPNVARLPRRMWVFHPTMFVSHKCYERLGGYDTSYRYAMDSEWCHRAIRSGARFHDVGEPLACMALGGQSDRNYVDALREYRRSVILHRLAGPCRAWLTYLTVRAGKTVLRLPYLGRLVSTLGRSGLARSSRHSG